MARGSFRMTRGQARSLAEAIRKADWVQGVPGDYSITLAHADGTEVTISVQVPRQQVQPFVVRGFQPRSE